MSRSRDLGDVGSKANFLDNVSTDLGDFSGQSIPHIIPDVLYPAVEGKDLAGVAFSGSYVYGTAHTDNRKYYYTDIKGSKPIKDPRIGGHFGSQRHKFKSIQLLEQETATHGKNVYTIDGREWARAVDAESGALSMGNSTNGVSLNVASDKEAWIEIVGYFNAVNLIMRVMANRKSVTPYINGVAGSTQNPSEASVTTPLDGRYVDSGSLASLTLPSTSLGINTLLIKDNDDSSQYTNYYHGIELIAQDTTSTANRSKIQIPSQNVVSYGKKFNVSGTPHYDPFTTMSYGGSGTTLSALQSLIDTDTSLGMDAWKAGTSNYHRPWNGGRVIRWVDSSGAIKTSVNMMPPNGQNIGTTASNAVSDAHVIAGTNDDTINFNTSAIDHSQAEVAKTFHWREFGNGSANGGAVTASTGGSYKDASMLSGDADIAYVMDDGLTSYSGDDATPNTSHSSVINAGGGTWQHITFIGTGVTLTGDEYYTSHAVAQNLPYGTHILRLQMQSGVTDQIYEIDGVAVYDSGSAGYGEWKEVTFHQPKKPPIPEDACVLADYMLMADFVGHSATGIEKISKGVRLQSCSRDVFYNGGSSSFGQDLTSRTGFRVFGNTTYNLPIFGTNFGLTGFSSRCELTKDGTNNTSLVTNSNTNNSDGKAFFTNSFDLGVYTMGHVPSSGQNGNFNSYDIATPIHTSHHYQSFETPFLHELIGGDRNMEQTNLVVSPDGKTWDQITRDVSYIKKGIVFLGTRDGGNVSATNPWFCDYVRGQFRLQNCVQKEDIAISYDRLIFLKSGTYAVDWQPFYNGAGWAYVSLSTTSADGIRVRSNYADFNISKRYYINVKRGDYLYISQTNGGSLSGDTSYFSQLAIEKV